MNGNPESSIKFTNPPPWENKEQPRGDRTNDEVVGITPREELPSSSASSVTAAGDEEHMTPSDESASFLSHSEDGYDEDEDEIGEGSGMGKDDYDEEKGSLRLPRKRPQPLAAAAAAAATVTAAVRTRPLYSEEEERAVIKKFDRKLVLFVALLYLLAFLDRSNIGNALISGLDADLQPPSPNPNLYSYALTAFYVTYILFEPLSVLWSRVPARVLISVIVFSWGLAASLQAVSPNYPFLIVCRAVLGVGEAGFTGIPIFLGKFFKREEMAIRTGIFISAAPLATSFASSLAWGIMKLAESTPIASWRLLFLIEGFPSVLVAGIAWNLIPDSPDKAKYLTKREKKVAKWRLQTEKAAVQDENGPKNSTVKDMLKVLIDPAAWMSALILFLTNLAYSSMPVFLPTILREMGHTPMMSQALAAPPYLASFFILLATAHVSDRLKARGGLLIFNAIFSASGYAMLASAEHLRLDPGSWIRYLAVYPATIGFFNVVVLTITWNINNQKGETRQGVGFALMQIIGQLGPLIGTRLYPDRDGPYYTEGMTVCAGAMAGAAAVGWVGRWYLRRENRRMDREEERGREGGDQDEGEALVGEKDRARKGRGFRYML